MTMSPSRRRAVRRMLRAIDAGTEWRASWETIDAAITAGLCVYVPGNGYAAPGTGYTLTDDGRAFIR